MLGRNKTKPPLINSDVAPTSQAGTTPRKKTQAKTNLRYLVDVTSADHGDRDTPPGPETEFRKKGQTEFPREVSRMKSRTVVVLSSEEQPKAGKELGRGGGKRKGGCACLESRVRK
jgi:hypothetical protein